MTVDLRELRTIITMLLDVAEENGIKVESKRDYYWDVSAEDRYDPYTQPAQLTIGQLSDDWNELRRIGRGETPALPYALVWLASVIRCMGEEISPASRQ